MDSIKIEPEAADREALVSHFERFPRSPVAENGPAHQVIAWPAKLPTPEPRIFCAYNQTRQQFLCAHVELLDLSPENLSEHFASLTPASTKAIWLAPFRGISATNVDAPIDLVFLDRNNCVLSVVESFPVTQQTSCNWPAGTAIALSAQSVASSGTLAGDQLVLCSPEKMKRRFLNLRGMGINGETGSSAPDSEDLPSNPYSIAHYLPPVRKSHVKVSSWEEVFKQPRPVQQVPAPAPPTMEISAEASRPGVTPQEAAADPADTPKNWLFCLLTPRRREKRKSARVFLPWIAAYFFNGGNPAPTSVRNISMSGMYISTSERWYLGTIIHVTLTDWRLPTPDRSVTVNAMAVRWGDDGVGLRFIFPKPRRGATGDDSLVDVTPQQLKTFLQHFKTGKQS
jgi:hypothetical protein